MIDECETEKTPLRTHHPPTQSDTIPRCLLASSPIFAPHHTVVIFVTSTCSCSSGKSNIRMSIPKSLTEDVRQTLAPYSAGDFDYCPAASMEPRAVCLHANDKCGVDNRRCSTAPCTTSHVLSMLTPTAGARPISEINGLAKKSKFTKMHCLHEIAG